MLLLLYLGLGMYKPHWMLFGIKNPSRFLVLVFFMIGLMVDLTFYGEGLRRKQETSKTISTKPAEKVNTSQNPEKTEVATKQASADETSAQTVTKGTDVPKPSVQTEPTIAKP